jgi:hypothetical protein
MTAENHTRLPVAAVPRRLETFDARQEAVLIWGFLALGIAIRAVRYLLCFPLWNDEAMLAVNFLDRGYRGLLQPLDCGQVGPPLFLWLELAAVRLLGFNEFSLRLFPFASGIAGLLAFRYLATMLFRGSAAVVAVAIFAVSYPGIRYAAEAKPYSSDMLVAVVLLALAAKWWRDGQKPAWLWLLAAVVPAAMALSLPAVFVAGGLSLAIASVLGRSGARRGWGAWTIYNISLAGSFLVLFVVSIKAQADWQNEFMERGWRDAFPPLTSAVKFLTWLVRTHAGPLLAQPVGGENGGSAGTLVACAVAVIALGRRRRKSLLVLCLAPFGLNLLAAALGRYPYGGHVRMAMYLAPAVCLLAGFGAVACLGRLQLSIRAARRRWPVAVLLSILALLGAGVVARDARLPAKSQYELRNRDFAAWFWPTLERGHEVACVKNDLGEAFPPPGHHWRQAISWTYLCNQRIYSRRHACRQPLDLGRVSRARPLACVQYWHHSSPYDQAAFNGWLAKMKSRYALLSRQDYPLSNDDRSKQPLPPDRVEVYEFVPLVTAGKKGD